MVHLFRTSLGVMALATASVGLGGGVQAANGPFNHSGIGELNPTLRRAVRMLSGIRFAIACRATILVMPSADLLASGKAIA